jgi:hypothetical protein
MFTYFVAASRPEAVITIKWFGVWRHWLQHEQNTVVKCMPSVHSAAGDFSIHHCTMRWVLHTAWIYPEVQIVLI